MCAHTHMPFVRLVNRRRVISAGGIGLPCGRSGGAWALLRDGNVSLRHTAVDVDAAMEDIVAHSAYPDRHAWSGDYLTTSSSDTDALTAFAPRDGRATL